MEISVYNQWHNGDYFYSRCHVSALKEAIPGITKINSFYNPKSIRGSCFLDDPLVVEIPGVPDNLPYNYSDHENLYFNTWIGCHDYRFIHIEPKGCGFYNYLHLINHDLELAGLPKVKDHRTILPKIDWKNLPGLVELDKRIVELFSKYEKKVLWCNGVCRSGQTDPGFIDFLNSKISEKAKSSPSTIHIVTDYSEEFKEIPNIVFTTDITKVHAEFLYISRISMNCDVIIGQESGPYTACNIVENIFNQNQKWVCFSRGVPQISTAGAYFYPERLSEVVVITNHHPEIVASSLDFV